MFNGDEVEALAIGMRMVESWGDRDLRAAARSILDKVIAVVPKREQDQLKGTALFSLRFGKQEQASQSLGQLRRSINERRKLTFDYTSMNEERSHRTVRPLGLFFWGHSWTLAAWCELRSGFRNFRSDRVSNVELESERFELAPPCTLEDYIDTMRCT